MIYVFLNPVEQLLIWQWTECRTDDEAEVSRSVTILYVTLSTIKRLCNPIKIKFTQSSDDKNKLMRWANGEIVYYS